MNLRFLTGRDLSAGHSGRFSVKEKRPVKFVLNVKLYDTIAPFGSRQRGFVCLSTPSVWPIQKYAAAAGEKCCLKGVEFYIPNLTLYVLLSHSGTPSKSTVFKIFECDDGLKLTD